MSVDNGRGKTAQPASVGGAVPGTAVGLPTELTHIEPTRNDEATQQGAYLIYCFPIPRCALLCNLLCLRLITAIVNSLQHMTAKF